MESPVDDVNHKKIRANQRVKTKRYQGPSKRIDACRYGALRAREITAQQISFEVPTCVVVLVRFDISKYRDTCESSIPILIDIAILRYFRFLRYFRYFRYLRYLRYLRYFRYFRCFRYFRYFDIESIRRRRCEGAISLTLLMTSLFTGAITTTPRCLT